MSAADRLTVAALEHAEDELGELHDWRVTDDDGDAQALKCQGARGSALYVARLDGDTVTVERSGDVVR